MKTVSVFDSSLFSALVFEVVLQCNSFSPRLWRVVLHITIFCIQLCCGVLHLIISGPLLCWVVLYINYFQVFIWIDMGGKWKYPTFGCQKRFSGYYIWEKLKTKIGYWRMYDTHESTWSKGIKGNANLSMVNFASGSFIILIGLKMRQLPARD